MLSEYCRKWKEITLNSSSDQSQYRVWDYPIKEQYGHILMAIEKAGPVRDIQEGLTNVIIIYNKIYVSVWDIIECQVQVPIFMY